MRRQQCAGPPRRPIRAPRLAGRHHQLLVTGSGGHHRDRIVDEDEPAARKADGGNEYLRYNDDIVTVGPAAGGGSNISVEDLDGRYRGGHFVYLGPGFTPGSPAAGNTSGGSGDAK